MAKMNQLRGRFVSILDTYLNKVGKTLAILQCFIKMINYLSSQPDIIYQVLHSANTKSIALLLHQVDRLDTVQEFLIKLGTL